MIRGGRAFWQTAGMLLTVSLLLVGCLSHPRLETVLYDHAGVVVSLKEFPDASVQASHPMVVEPSLMASLLAGLRVQAHQTLIESALSGETPVVPVFSPSEIDLLAPLLTDALNRATAVEQVRFRLEGSEDGIRVTRAGSLFLTERDVIVWLTHYGRMPQRPPTLSRPSQSFDRSKRWTLTFVPAAAMVSRGVETIVPADAAELHALAINLQLLARASGRGRPAASEGGDTDRVPVDEEPTQDAEAMEEDLQRLRRSLQEQERRLQQLERQLQGR